jgi:N-acetylglucosamine malate deacetylase 2
MSDSQPVQLFNRLFEAHSEGPRLSVMVVVAHPDDEVVGAGAWLQRWSQVSFVHVTDGAPIDLKDARENGFANREDYARARRQEFQAALRMLNLASAEQVALNFTDQETASRLPELSSRLQSLFVEHQPDVVVTHPYEGGHPDHDSIAWAVAAACRRMRQEGQAAPLIVEMTSYHNGTYGMVTAQFLPDGTTPMFHHELTPQECSFKRKLYACYKTQQRTLRWFPIEAEAFRIAPQYDFSKPPHEGKLFYEQFKWGMDGARWRLLAARASRDLPIASVA